jgi:hypothetical protein
MESFGPVAKDHTVPSLLVRYQSKNRLTEKSLRSLSMKVQAAQRKLKSGTPDQIRALF